jgi:hypothetical protein
MSSIKRQLLLRAYLLAETGPVPSIDYEQQTHTFTRYYLSHLAMGGRAHEARDLVIVDMFLDNWDLRLTRKVQS